MALGGLVWPGALCLSHMFAARAAQRWGAVCCAHADRSSSLYVGAQGHVHNRAHTISLSSTYHAWALPAGICYPKPEALVLVNPEALVLG